MLVNSVVIITPARRQESRKNICSQKRKIAAASSDHKFWSYLLRWELVSDFCLYLPWDRSYLLYGSWFMRFLQNAFFVERSRRMYQPQYYCCPLHGSVFIISDKEEYLKDIQQVVISLQSKNKRKFLKLKWMLWFDNSSLNRNRPKIIFLWREIEK